MNPQVPSDFSIFPVQASEVAAHIDIFYLVMVAISAFFCITIPGAIIYFAVKYRRRPGNDEGRRVKTSKALELTWTIIPFFIVLGMFFWGTRVYFIHAAEDPNALEILVTGKKWMWKFQHKNGRREIQHLHLPVNTPIRLKMSSEDVLHSLFIPAFRQKQDVLPGRYSYLNIKATRPGVYHLFCNQYCGTSHSSMIGKVVVMEPGDYQRWLGGYTGQPPEKVGEALFSSLACNTCHAGDSGARGPVLNGIVGTQVALQNGNVVTVDDDYLRESILNPQAKIVAGYQPIMPSFQGVVSQDQVNALIAYIKTLPAGKDTSAAGPAGPDSVVTPPPAVNSATGTADQPAATSDAESGTPGQQDATAAPQPGNEASTGTVTENNDAATTAGEAVAPQPASDNAETTPGEQQGVQ